MNTRALSLAAALCASIAADSVLAGPRKLVEPRKASPRSAARNGAKPARPATPAADATDFYYYDGQRIPLRRSRTEAVVRVNANAAVPGRDVVSEGRRFRIVQASEQLQAMNGVEAVAGVFEEPKTRTKLLATDEVVVKLRAGGTKQELLARAEAHGLRVDRMVRGTTDEYVLRLVDPKHDDTLEKARLLHESGAFAWAEPHFLRQYRKQATPNDASFALQWHLNNTGQFGGTAGADVNAVAAWNTQTGSSSIVIAVVDDGVEKTHEDLAANLFTNPGEIAGNGIDDDHNGYVDDVNGWDFSGNDNDAGHSELMDGHGTSVAGVAAARGNNTTGVTGACHTCRILPVRIFSDEEYAGDVATANALRYAASFADVVNNSWGGGSPSATLRSAIQTGTTSGRGGKGSAMLFATGNDASGNQAWIIEQLPAGTHRFRWSYEKDESLDDGEDSAWLSWIIFPGNTLVNFENGMPTGFTTGGDAPWSVVTDARHSDEGRCYVKAAKAGAIDDDEFSWIQAVRTVPAGDLIWNEWVSSEFEFDNLYLDIDFNNDGTFEEFGYSTGVPYVDLDVSYPAAYPEAIAVGASTNFDCRSHYSQFGPEVAFVAPSSGGPLNAGIQTTDRTGADGYDTANYTGYFGGTSSATPLASGIAGLLLSRNPSLSLTQLTAAMKNSADKVGSEPYVGGRNNRYGHGRLDADAALLSIAACATIDVSPIVDEAQTLNAFSQSFVVTGGVPTYIYAVTVGTLPPGLTLSATGLLSGTPTAVGTYSFTVQVTDANGCTGYRAVNLAVTAGSPPPPGSDLYIVTPCRVIDSRDSSPLAHLATRDVQISGVCGIPASASAVVANITAVNPGTTGFLALYPTGSVWPGTSTMNYRSGRTRANNAVLPLSNLGKATILNNGASQHFIIDVTGYFE